MENPTKGQYYYVKQYGTKNNNVQRYSHYRAKYIGQIKGSNKYFEFTNVNNIGEKRVATYVMLILSKSITKMEDLKDITNEMLPNDLLLKIDEYL